VLTSHAWTPDGGLVKDPPRDALAALAARPDAVLWLDFENPSGRELTLVRSAFGVSTTAMEDVRHVTSLPKVENYGEYLLVTLHRVQFDESTREMRLREIDFLLGRNWLVTVRADASTSVEEIHQRVSTNPQGLRDGPGRVMADIVEAVTHRYFPMVEFLEREIDVLEEGMLLGRESSEEFARILALRHSVVGLRRSLVPQREVISRLSRHEFALAESMSQRMHNVHDELYWILTELEIHRELLTSAFEGHAALAANRLAGISNRTNRVMERLTRFTTVFMPLTLITGIYGMNFDWMPELRWKPAYPLTLLALVVTGFAIGLYFKVRLAAEVEAVSIPQPPPGATRIWRRSGEAPPEGPSSSKSTGIGR
jgi:magnesium transporter